MWERDESSWQKPDVVREQLSASDVLRSAHRKGHKKPEDSMNTKLLAGITLAAALSLAAQAQNGASAGAVTGAGAIFSGGSQCLLCSPI